MYEIGVLGIGHMEFRRVFYYSIIFLLLLVLGIVSALQIRSGTRSSRRTIAISLYSRRFLCRRQPN